MKIKIDYKKICIFLAVILTCCFMLNSVQARVTGKDGAVVKNNASLVDNVLNTIKDLVNKILGMATSGVFATVCALINLLAIALFAVLYVVFAWSTSSWTMVPFPDTIVFNRVMFFDPNFIAPSTGDGSLINGFGSVLKNLFTSFQTIAMAVLLIAAMITGIKMALSTIASKRAQYKEAALKWLSGFVILFCLKWIIAAIFYANEVIVSKLYDIANTDGVKIPIYFTDALPIFGSTISSLVKAFESITGFQLHVEVSGYLGIALANICKSIGGNIVASMVAFVIMRSDNYSGRFIFEKRIYVRFLRNYFAFDSCSRYNGFLHWRSIHSIF